MISTFAGINGASAAVITAILNGTLISAAAAVIVWAALRVARVRAGWRHVAWWAVLAAVVAAPFVPRVVQRLTPGTAAKQQFTDVEVSMHLKAPASSQNASGTVEQPSKEIVVPMHLKVPASAVKRDSQPGSSLLITPANSTSPSVQSRQAYVSPRFAFPFEIHGGYFPAILFATWLAVSVALMARVIYSYAHLRRIRSRATQPSAELISRFARCLQHAGIPSHPQLLVSSGIASPFAAGFLHPVVVLPAQLLDDISAAELDNVLLHELAHFARRDNWTNLLARLSACVAILHPIAAFALSRIEREREIACDDWAIAVSGSARQYAATLARLFEICGVRRRELLATGMAHRSSRLGERIEMALRQNRALPSRASLSRVALCAVAGAPILFAAAQAPSWIAFAQDVAVPPAPPVMVIRPLAPIPPAVPITPPPGAAFVPPIAGIKPLALFEPFAPLDASTPVPPTPPLAPTPAVDATLPVPPIDAVPAVPPAQLTPPLPGAGLLAPMPPGAGLPHESWSQQDWSGWQSEWSIQRSRSSFSTEIHLSFGYRRGDSHWMESNDVKLSTLRDFSPSMLDHDGPIKFEYVRQAGALVCEGNVRNGRASGSFTVSPNQEFISALEKMGYPTPDDRDMVSLMMSDISLNFARDVKSTGLNLTVGDLGELRGHDVSADYIRQARQAGLTQLTPDDFCELRTHGVEPQYLQRILAADPKLTADDISELRTHGVESDYLKGILATGMPLTTDEISTLRTHGVEPTYFQSVHAANPKLSIDDITELRIHGAEPDYVHGIEAADPGLTSDQVSQLRTHGVEPEYLKGILATGIHLTIDEICELRVHGVEPDYLKGIATAGANLTADEISELRTHGVEPDYYKQIKSADPKLTIDDVTNLRTHGVEPDYYKEAKSINPKLTVDEITRLRTHGVDLRDLKELRSAIPGMTVDDAIGLSQHGVAASFVAEAVRQGYHFTASELSNLYGHGVDAAYLRTLQETGMKNLTASQILKLRGIS